MAKNITFENGRRTTTDNLFPTTIIELERQFGSKIELVDGEPYKAENGLATPGKKKYEITFEDTFSFAIDKKTAELTDAQYQKALQQKKDKDIVVNKYDKAQGIHYNLRIKDIKPALVDFADVSKAKRGTKTGTELTSNNEFPDYHEEKYPEYRTYLKRLLTHYFGLENRYSRSSDWGGIPVWTIKGDLYEGTFIGIDDNNSLFLITRKFDEKSEENIDTEIMSTDADARVNWETGKLEKEAQSELRKIIKKALELKTTKMKAGGKTATGPIKASASAILKELIDTDIIDEEHPLYEQSKNAIASGNSEEITGILDELIQADIIDKSHPEYKAIKNITKAENGLDTENYEPIKITDIEIGKTKEFGNFSVMRKKKNTFILSNVKGGPRNRWGTINQINEDLQYALENGKLPDPYKFASSGMKTAEDVEDVSGWDDEELANYLGIKTSEIQNDREGYEEQATDLMVEGANNHDEMKLGGKAGRGMSTPSIERHVKEVNRLIALAKNSKGEPLTVTDRSGSWQSPMIYEPIVYKNGRMTVKYKELDLYSHNRSKGVISQWEEKKDVILKSQMSFDHPLNIIAKLYRKALKDEGIDYKTKAEETPGLKTYRCGGKMARVGVKTGNIKPSKEFMVFNYTDNIYASPDTFANQKKAKEFVKEFRNRFATQGYYKDNRMRQVAIKDIDLEIIPANFSPFTGEYN